LGYLQFGVNYDRFLGNSRPNLKAMEETIQFHARQPTALTFDLHLVYIFLIWITCVPVTVISLGIALLTSAYYNFLRHKSNKVARVSNSLASVNSLANIIQHAVLYDPQ